MTRSGSRGASLTIWVSSVYRATEDLYLTQRFARYSSPLTTSVYTHVSDEKMYARLRDIA